MKQEYSLSERFMDSRTTDETPARVQFRHGSIVPILGKNIRLRTVQRSLEMFG